MGCGASSTPGGSAAPVEGMPGEASAPGSAPATTPTAPAKPAEPPAEPEKPAAAPFSLVTHPHFNHESFYASRLDDGDGRRSVATWMNGVDPYDERKSKWIFKDMEDGTLIITNAYYDGNYLYAAANDDGEGRRYVYAWMKGGAPEEDPQARWKKKELADGTVVITSVQYEDNYLYAAQTNDGKGRRSIFCWMNGGAPEEDPQAKWKISADEVHEEVHDWVCEMCKDIPHATEPGKTSKLQSIRNALAFMMGKGWEKPMLPESVKTFYDMAARFLVPQEVKRVLEMFPSLPNFMDKESEVCFSLELLRGRTVMVVNTASK
mmetsp:Transcript_7457/g.13417  ORF Transcript_7457/g.13417 Transcript_7457/m.13417 type:complete len:320 (-) Transcript_7457:216-1175(-)